jgi:hypothetical protein
MRIVLKWNHGWFLASIGMIISQCPVSDEDCIAVKRGMVCNKYRNDNSTVPYF